MTEPSGTGRAALVRRGVEFDARDAALLRAIDERGSVAAASNDLGRSRARDLARIEELEGAFGRLVERRRGGSDGGGSSLTGDASRLLNRYERLTVALEATARVPETVLEGCVVAVSGELADVETDVGMIQGLHDGVSPGEAVQARIGADALTVLAPGAGPDPRATSARNRLVGTVAEVDRGETVNTVRMDAGGERFSALVTDESADRLGLEPDRDVVVTWKATATRLVSGAAGH